MNENLLSEDEIKNKIEKVNEDLPRIPSYIGYNITSLISIVEELQVYKTQIDLLKNYLKEDGRHLDHCTSCNKAVKHKVIMHGDGHGYHKVVCKLCGGNIIDYMSMTENILYQEERADKWIALEQNFLSEDPLL